ncbi:TetR/AcrR family transcriptional regulator [Halalkalibacter nanhaiisediminis]|uniref:TetR family transcriptional regulator n=1 Tax=Halalkalibacter nanhaiisediminis TaxID=688079 RepID=A0A562QJ10_9BACI|nr:TetR/AcrR family transcriptional regulator [Halalkalibacter nanhaiisediminis]TWI56160.1 TetR family transcriptional regulator [Halalkalibacter nanhaiisediminis]
MTVDRRNLILEAATKSFSMFGYKATTMDQVAKLANVGKGTIYTFFTNKEELFHEIVITLIQDMKHAAEDVIKEDASFHENAHHAILRMLEYRKQHQLTIKLFQEEKELGTHAVQEVMQQIERAILNFIKEKVEQAIENDEIKPCNTELTAFLMLKLYIALIFDWEQHHEPLDEKQILHLFELYVMNGLSIS